MEVIGYCDIKKGATTGRGANLENFIGKVCRVFEFDREGGVLVIDNAATGLASFDACDVLRKFECTSQGDVLMPPGLNVVDQLMYMGKVMGRKGGYNNMLKQMVIQASLMKGKFNDGFLFAIQEEEEAAERQRHRNIKDIKDRMAKGGKVTFAERNIINIEAKRTNGSK